MTELNLKNINPVVLSTHYGTDQKLRASYDGRVLDPDDTILVGLASSPEGGPVEVSVQLLQPIDGPAIKACHEQNNQPSYWDPIEDPAGYSQTWSATGHEYPVGVAGTPDENGQTPVEPVIHIKVKPIEDLPDPSAP